MEIEVQLTNEPIAGKISPPRLAAHGAWLEFRGAVRDEENGEKISGLEYEAYPEMAGREIRRRLETLSTRHPCLAARVIHRVGIVPAGEAAIYVGIASRHRAEAIALLGEFMNQLKQGVPIWKRRALPVGEELKKSHVPLTPSLSPPGGERVAARPDEGKFAAKIPLISLDEAGTEIRSHCRPLPAARAPLAEAFGRVLRETVCAPEDLPPMDRSTRDGYAIRADDASDTFSIMDTLHAADWKPRQLKPGEAVRVATGASLPCDNLRVVMQENVERTGDKIRIVRRETAANISFQGEDLRAGEPLLHAGAKLDAGALAVLATAGHVSPLVSRRLRVVHYTTGDEIIPPDQTPKPGQIRDSNSVLIRGLLQDFPCDLEQAHLPEDFEMAKAESGKRKAEIENADVLLVSGGASVGEKDFTRPLLEWLGFEIVFTQINLRPGRPLIFGINGGASVPASRLVGSLAPPNKIRVAFGLPGNPLSHFVCFHFAVATALACLTGSEPQKFLRGQLADKLDDTPCPRETLWPAKWEISPDSTVRLHPLAWANSGNVACLASANALVRVPANVGAIEADAEVDFLPTAIE
jgi:molybdopterin molybdotransferase